MGKSCLITLCTPAVEGWDFVRYGQIVDHMEEAYLSSEYLNRNASRVSPQLLKTAPKNGKVGNTDVLVYIPQNQPLPKTKIIWFEAKHLWKSSVDSKLLYELDNKHVAVGKYDSFTRTLYGLNGTEVPRTIVQRFAVLED